MRKRILALAVLCLSLTFLPALALAENAPTATPAPVMTRDPNAGLYKPAPTPRPMPSKPNVVMLYFPEVDIEADKLDVRVYFPNSEKNEGWYDLAFTLWAAIPAKIIEEGVETTVLTRIKEETGEEEEVLYAKLFSSGLVPAGYCLQDITMNQPVPEGSFDAILTAQPYDIKTGLPTKNSSSTRIRLNAYQTQTPVATESTEAPTTVPTEDPVEAEETQAPVSTEGAQ